MADDMLVASVGGRDFTGSRAFVEESVRLANIIKEKAITQGDDFDADSDVFKAVDNFDNFSFKGRLNYNRANGDDLSATTVGFLQDITKVNDNAQRRGLEGRGDTQSLFDTANAWTSLWDPVLDPASKAKASSEKAGDGANFEDLLDDAKSETSSKGMSALLSKAIAALIAELLGEQGEDTPTNPAPKPENATTPTAAPAPAAPPSPPVEQRLSGDSLASQMDANGKGLTVNKDGSLGIRDGKKDRNRDEIRGSQVMTFKPRMNMGDERAVQRFDSATVEVSKLFGDKGGKRQEKGFIDVIDNGKVVDRIEMRGDQDGKQSVEITQPFTELKFSTAGGKDDYAVSSITVRKGGEAPDESQNASPANSTESPTQSDAGGDTSARLVGLLRALEDAIKLIEEMQKAGDGVEPSADDEDAIPPMLQAILKILSAIQAARGKDTPGGKEITAKELAEIMQAVEQLLEPFQNSTVDEKDKKTTYNNIMTAMEAMEDLAA